eukprot:1159164-Pelagomonas_calceolata.AAC.13
MLRLAAAPRPPGAQGPRGDWAGGGVATAAAAAAAAEPSAGHPLPGYCRQQQQLQNRSPEWAVKVLLPEQH